MSAKRERPFNTFSALSAPASTPRKLDAANGSSTTGTLAVDGLTAPSIFTARWTASSATGSHVSASRPRVIA